MKEGVIFSIEEFAIHDGPGIRTTVFLKGCPLRCNWCHNPEGISPKPEWMDKKTGRTLSGQVMTTDELAGRLLKNKPVFDINNGGVTLTGGEPLMQADFVVELLGMLPDIHKVIETSGQAPSSVFERVIPLVDLVLMDLKHMDSATHKRYTGVGNELILKNARFLIASGKEFIIRIPLIPGVNDTRENMEAVADFLKDAASLVRVELMPYHKTAGAKYAMVGQTYQPMFDTEARPAIITEPFEKNNIKTLIL